MSAWLRNEGVRRMDKEQYKRLLTLRKSEEEMFYQLIKLSDKSPRELIKMLPINHKRAWYLLDKWSQQDKYSYGVTLDLGWVTESRSGEVQKEVNRWYEKHFDEVYNARYFDDES